MNIQNFDSGVIYLKLLLSAFLINPSTTIDFALLCVEYISISLSCIHGFIDLLLKIYSLYLPIFSLVCD